MQHQHPTTIAILGADTVVGSALSALLEGSSYRIAPIGSHPTGVVDELLDGADLLLLVPRLGQDAREAFLGAIGKCDPLRAEMPVIALCTALEQTPPEEGVKCAPWPCETRALVKRIEAALAGRSPEDALAVSESAS